MKASKVTKEYIKNRTGPKPDTSKNTNKKPKTGRK
jgi:hypothetical protein